MGEQRARPCPPPPATCTTSPGRGRPGRGAARSLLLSRAGRAGCGVHGRPEASPPARLLPRTSPAAVPLTPGARELAGLGGGRATPEGVPMSRHLGCGALWPAISFAGPAQGSPPALFECFFVFFFFAPWVNLSCVSGAPDGHFHVAMIRSTKVGRGLRDPAGGWPFPALWRSCPVWWGHRRAPVVPRPGDQPCAAPLCRFLARGGGWRRRRWWCGASDFKFTFLPEDTFWRARFSLTAEQTDPSSSRRHLGLPRPAVASSQPVSCSVSGFAAFWDLQSS